MIKAKYICPIIQTHNKAMNAKINKLEQSAREHAIALKTIIEQVKGIDPVAASNVYKASLQYLQDSEIRHSFTLGELEELGYLPKVY